MGITTPWYGRLNPGGETADGYSVAHICQVHPYEAAEGLCRTCGGPFCADCLVYPFGPAKPPFCVPCAIAAGGVRRNARNPNVVVPKEKKERLKEWRRARRRDLDSPPPDGVATWQRMDDASAEIDDLAAEEEAAREREALRLPPPEPETPTPPPGVNLAPPGPPGSDWREGMDLPVATNFGPPGSSFDRGDDDVAGTEPAPEPETEPLLGAWVEPAAPEPPPRPLADPWTGPAPFEPNPFEPTPLGVETVAVPVEGAADPLASSFGAPPPDPGMLTSFGLGPPDDPTPPTPPPPPAKPSFADIPRSAIRPPVPTRIPAAPTRPAPGDAKALLARIAALRAERGD